MKKVLNKTESWLLIAPFILSIIFYIANRNEVADLHFVDTYFIIENPVLGFLIISLLLLIVPFLMHLLLRKMHQRNAFVSNLHVIFTILILSSFYFLMARPEERHTFQLNFSRPRFTAENLLALFVIVQVLFLIYSIIHFIISSVKYMRRRVRRNDV